MSYQFQQSVSVAFDETGENLDIIEQNASEVSTSSAPSPSLADSRPMVDSIAQLEREIAFISSKLETGSYDPNTGEFKPAISGAERDRMEQHAAMLSLSLRDQQALEQQRVAAVAARKAEAAARQQAVEARALEMLEAEGIEAAARELADAIKASRG